jgi:hypothetical protein
MPKILVVEKFRTYNRFMLKINCLVLIISFTSMQMTFADSISASVDANMAAQRSECDKHTAMEWSSKLNRCIGKKAAVDARNEAKGCDSLADLSAKEKCHLNLAEKNTSLASDTSKLNQGNTSGSMLMNGAASIYSAYASTDIILDHSKKNENSNCMSKKILGVTAVAGLASDVYLKMKAKKTVKDLEGKYMLDINNTTYEAQVKALEYLKQEQQTVIEIASMEKKRNMMLMLGYALATGWAIYEMTPYGANPNCVPKKDEKNVSAQADIPSPAKAAESLP